MFKKSLFLASTITIALAGIFSFTKAQQPIVTPQENVRIGTIERPPLVIKNTDGSLSGFSIELWNLIAKELELNSTFQEFDVFSEMIDAVEQGSVDASIANISVTLEREQVMDFTQPIYDSGLQVVTTTTNQKPNFLNLIWDSGIILFLGIAVGVLLVIAHVLWFFERNVSDSRHDYFRDTYLQGVWDAFWWAFIIMTMGGFEKEVPHKVISRIIAMTWIVVSLFFISTLTAKITTALTVSELQSGIQSYKDLANKNVGIPESPIIRDFLTNEGIAYTEFKTLDALKNALEQGTIDAIVHDAPIMQYYVKQDQTGIVRLAGEVFHPDTYSILLPENSTLKERIDQSLIKFKQDGTYKKLRNKYFGT